MLVDKTISYAQNANAGVWQNTLMFMGDDGNGNLHMQDADEVANDVLTTYPAYLVKKVMWKSHPQDHIPQQPFSTLDQLPRPKVVWSSL